MQRSKLPLQLAQQGTTPCQALRLIVVDNYKKHQLRLAYPLQISPSDHATSEGHPINQQSRNKPSQSFTEECNDCARLQRILAIVDGVQVAADLRKELGLGPATIVDEDDTMLRATVLRFEWLRRILMTRFRGVGLRKVPSTRSKTEAQRKLRWSNPCSRAR